MVQFNEEKQNERLDELRKREEEELTQRLAIKYGLPYLDLAAVSINIDALRVLPEDRCRAANLAVFNIVDRELSVGILSPNQPQTQAEIEDLKSRNYQVRLFMVTHQGLNKVWERYKDLSFSFETKSGALDISNDQILELMEKVRTIDDVRNLIKEVIGQNKSYRISRTLEIILSGALALKASDVHLEPEESYVRLRYRLDGVLNDILQFDSETYNLILSRIKLLSNLKLNIKNRAQDGRFSIKLKDNDIEIRTSLLPGAYNETIVMRMLNPKSIAVPLEELGINSRLLSILEREMEKPNGMILTTGPTGSGKTTTLYACLRKIHTPAIKIITIENPIEYHLPGIVQTQTDSDENYTFSQGLRSALRQDPDVIMVGEIRDAETAEIAVHSALTGHLVFSTLHTNNAAGTYPRLIDLGINPKILPSAITLSMAQRLVRKLCPICKKQVPLEGKPKQTVDFILSTVTDKSYLDGINASVMYEPVGCNECNGLGYKGRLGIYEAIVTDEILERIVNENPSEREIKKATAAQDILDMKQDGILKVLQGMTSLDELRRVIDLEAL
ncbi:MAG TPA: type II/IV secretion system protein [Candidatus Paceibacterota bacterium]|jgi:type IV pilus assembly protein PilB|nr:type II/IV secretion system protein [Candidatus Paceibacterota bacterium]